MQHGKEKIYNATPKIIFLHFFERLRIVLQYYFKKILVLHSEFFSHVAFF